MEPFNRRFRVSCAMALAFAFCLTASGHAQYVFFDRFDTETVGTFPSTWTDVMPTTYGQLAVTNNLNPPSGPNVFQIHNVSNETFRADRVFPTMSLNVISQVVIGFSVRVDYLTNFNSAGAYIRLNNTVSGFETFGLVRILGADGTGGGATWSLYNDFYTINGGAPYPAQGLATGTWYKFRWEIDPSPTNAQTGTIRWFLNDVHINTENFTTPDAARTNFNDLVVTSLSSPVMRFSLDNVYAFSEIPEPGAMPLLAVGAAVVAMLRRKKGRNG